VLWNPQVLTSDVSFDVRSNQFGFNIDWASGLVEVNSNLSNPVWSPVGINTLTGGSYYFSDPKWSNYPVRVYRFDMPRVARRVNP